MVDDNHAKCEPIQLAVTFPIAALQACLFLDQTLEYRQGMRAVPDSYSFSSWNHNTENSD